MRLGVGIRIVGRNITHTKLLIHMKTIISTSLIAIRKITTNQTTSWIPLFHRITTLRIVLITKRTYRSTKSVWTTTLTMLVNKVFTDTTCMATVRSPFDCALLFCYRPGLVKPGWVLSIREFGGRYISISYDPFSSLGNRRMAPFC